MTPDAKHTVGSSRESRKPPLTYSRHRAHFGARANHINPSNAPKSSKSHILFESSHFLHGSNLLDSEGSGGALVSNLRFKRWVGWVWALFRCIYARVMHLRGVSTAQIPELNVRNQLNVGISHFIPRLAGISLLC